MGADSTRAPDGATTLTTKEVWDAAFSAWEAAKVAVDFFDAAHTTAHEEAAGTTSNALTRMDETLDRLLSDEASKRNSMLLVPAPDFAAVSQKLHFLFAQEYAELGDEDPYVSAYHRSITDALMADMARLQSEFAEAWLGPWERDGGVALVCPDGKLHLSFPTYELSPRYVAPADHMDEQFAQDFISTNAQHYHSTMNARVDALKVVPGGVDMIKAHVATKRRIWA